MSATTAAGASAYVTPVVGELDLDFEALTVPSEPGLQLNIYTPRVEGPPTMRCGSWRRGLRLPITTPP